MGSAIGDLFIHDPMDYGRKNREEAALRKNRESLAPDTADLALQAARRKDADKLLPSTGRAQTFLTTPGGDASAPAQTGTLPVLLNAKKPMGN